MRQLLAGAEVVATAAVPPETETETEPDTEAAEGRDEGGTGLEGFSVLEPSHLKAAFMAKGLVPGTFAGERALSVGSPERMVWWVLSKVDKRKRVEKRRAGGWRLLLAAT